MLKAYTKVRILKQISSDIENLSLKALESKLITADGILVGSPTINQNTLLPVYKLFSMINPIATKVSLGVLLVLTDGAVNLQK